MEHTPRALFAMLRAGMREEALSSNTFWMCVSCYHCAVRCPQEIHIADVMYTLKSMAIEANLYKDSTAADFSQTFIGMVEGYGRSFEWGSSFTHQASAYAPVAPMAIGMLSRKRMSLTPNRIKDLRQLKAILKRAKELEATQ
jgi:heterodisulfide reductase subunit C